MKKIIKEQKNEAELYTDAHDFMTLLRQLSHDEQLRLGEIIEKMQAQNNTDSQKG
jgi:hypothetical protein